MSFFKRIGTIRHKYKVQFFIKSVRFNKALGGNVYVSLRRGDHKINSKEVAPDDKVCNFNNELLALPKHTYQQKPGQIKIVLKTGDQEKKLLGIAHFDLATYANQAPTKTFKEKINLEQTPSHLKGHISFQVFIDYIGEGSENSKSVAKEEKSARDESPFGKIATFFGFGSDKEQNSKKEEKSEKDLSEEKKKNKKSLSEAEEQLFQPSRNKLKSSKPLRREDEEEDIKKEKKRQRLKTSQFSTQEKKGKEEKSKTEKAPAQKSDVLQDDEEAIFGSRKQSGKPKKKKEKNPQSKEPNSEKNIKNEEKKQKKINIQNSNQIDNIYFDDPETFKKNKQRQDKSTLSQQSKLEKKTERQSNEVKKDQNNSTPKRDKKVKQSSLPFPSKFTSQKDIQDDPNIHNQVIVEGISNPNVSKQQLSQKEIEEKVEKQVRKRLQEEKKELGKQFEKKEQTLLKEINTLKTEIKQTKTSQVRQSKEKGTQIESFKVKLKEADEKNATLESTVYQLKAQTNKLEMEVQKWKKQNQSLREEMDKNESFFRQTEERYQEKNKSKDSGLQEQVKRLERQKNQLFLTLQKEKEKNKKQVKKITQQLQKQSLRLKELQDISKAQLKRAKDQIISKNGSLETLQEKFKQKTKEQETLLKENKSMNSVNIDLRDKLASLKIKICQKLNEANQRGAFDIMEVLTDLNEELIS